MSEGAETAPAAAPVQAADPLGELAFVLTGGGARGAYQVGVMSWLGERYPELNVPILTGVSAGAINAAYLASRRGNFAQATAELVTLWTSLTPEDIFRADASALGWSVLRWGARLMSGGMLPAQQIGALLDTKPLAELLEEVFACVDGKLTGVDFNIHRGALKALAISTTSYTTGNSMVWVQGRDVKLWTRPMRRSMRTVMTVNHVMASAALPLFFPAVRIDSSWHGDGGVRMAAPLSPALHLGAKRIFAVSTRPAKSIAAADLPAVRGYPPPAQVFGVLMNAIFLDLIDQDAMRLERMNRLIDELPPDRRGGMKHIELLVMRPSRDLGRLVRAYEPRLPLAFRFMTRGLGTRETRSPDMLSMLMFQSDYLTRLIEIGKADAEARKDEIAEFIEGGKASPRASTRLGEGEA